MLLSAPRKQSKKGNNTGLLSQITVPFPETRHKNAALRLEFFNHQTEHSQGTTKLGLTAWHVIGFVPPGPVRLVSSPPESATHRPSCHGLSAARSPFLVETLESPEKREPVHPQLSPSYPPLRVLGASELHCPPAFTCRNAITSQRLLPKLAASPTTNDSAC
ncbi:uncharacterized protein CLUP02_13792 [Colletotrichum lupini]|uniref:Uncharacterized protein n=1 Tax=Colletotrichum lupini TaxID=145971 RepID=A0A9Q8WM02_9PEZI|nr:uncharacterized protein CLUP02_13792 [Colletotrichum lupini]UQC88269.1 hypothetical protein CLUP02_13792 [Colletotrichum lupini]